MKHIFLLVALVYSSFIYSEELPLEHFTRHGDYLDMRLSPDGKHIAARVRNDGKVMFVVLVHNIKQLTSFAATSWTDTIEVYDLDSNTWNMHQDKLSIAGNTEVVKV